MNAKWSMYVPVVLHVITSQNVLLRCVSPQKHDLPHLFFNIGYMLCPVRMKSGLYLANTFTPTLPAKKKKKVSLEIQHFITLFM